MMLRRLREASVWHPSAIPKMERKYATPLKRFVFPLFDTAVVILGVFGLASTGFKAVALTFPTPLPTILYGLLVVFGMICFLGAAFPALWAVELVGKSVILADFFVLIAAMLVAAAEVPGHTGAMISVLIGGLSLIPMLRLWILGVELAGRGS